MQSVSVTNGRVWRALEEALRAEGPTLIEVFLPEYHESASLKW